MFTSSKAHFALGRQGHTFLRGESQKSGPGWVRQEINKTGMKKKKVNKTVSSLLETH